MIPIQIFTTLFFKLSAKIKNYNYKYSAPKNSSLFALKKSIINYSENHSNNSFSEMPRDKSKKSKPTKARVTFSDNSPSNSTPGPNNSSKTEITPSTSAVDTAEDLRLTDTINRILSKKLP